MSYVEDAIYTFIKNIFTKGIIVLTNKRFIIYTSLAIILPIIITATSFIAGSEAAMTYQFAFNLELAVCVSLLVTGLISLKVQLLKVEHMFFLVTAGILFALSFSPIPIVNTVEDVIVFISFYSWIITTNIAGLMAIREFMISWPGWVIRLGDHDERITFSPIVKLGVFISILWFGYSIYTGFTWSLLMAFFAGAVMFYTIYVFHPITKDSIMTSIMAFFYFSLMYHLFVRAESSTGFLLIDIIFIVATTIFTAQSISNLIVSKKHALPYQWDSLIILLLGFMLGYHLLGVKIAFFSGLESLYSLYHDIAFGFGTMILFGALLLYIGNKRFRSFSKMRITGAYAAKKVSGLGLEAITKYAGNVKDAIKKKRWQIEIRKKKEDDDSWFED